jgi:hypothetical protein
VRYLSTVPAPRPEAPLSTQRIDLQVAAKIEGEESQIVTVELRKGEKLRAESASMIYMTEGTHASSFVKRNDVILLQYK